MDNISAICENEVVNPVVVTEVYVRQDAGWNLLSLPFTRLLGA